MYEKATSNPYIRDTKKFIANIKIIGLLNLILSKNHVGCNVKWNAVSW